MRKNSRVYDEKICHKIHASAIVDALMHQYSQTFATVVSSEASSNRRER